MTNLYDKYQGLSPDREFPLEMLLLCDRPPRVAGTLHQHIETLAKLPEMQVRVIEAFGGIPATLDFDRFDVVVIHYSLVLAGSHYISPKTRERIRSSRALKAVFIQDEYRHIDSTIAALREIKVDIIFTCMPEKTFESVYPEHRLPGVRKVNVLTGYVPTNVVKRTVKPFETRKIDVGYRARKVPAWLGDLGQEKWNIGKRFAVDARRYRLKCDISYREEERLYGEAWIRFLTNCKAILGVESGSSVFDFTGNVQAAVDTDIARYPNISYAELKTRHFAEIDGVIDQRQISPRCFEAAALRTLMIMYPGHYSGIMEPWRHYVPLAKDHSNMDQVARTLRDPVEAEAIIERAYREVACNSEYSFCTHATFVSSVLREEHAKRVGSRGTHYSDLEFSRDQAKDAVSRRRLLTRKVITYTHYLLFNWVLGLLSEARRDKISHWLGNYFKKTALAVRHQLKKKS